MISYHNIREYPGTTRTRLAPTPSGFLHLGNILSFSLTVHFARLTGASTLLRIDDMDQLRADKAYIDDIFETLHYMNIPWQEGPAGYEDFQAHYSQQQRQSLYQQALQQLVNNDQVFACTCSRSQLASLPAAQGYPGTCLHKKLPLDTPDACWRLKTDPGKKLTVHRLASTPVINSLPTGMHHFVVRKKDGDPAYQLCSVIDDQLMNVDLIVRGIDLWPSTWAQHYLAQCLNITSFQQAQFVHHPLLLGMAGQKLSKSMGDTSIQQLRKQGVPASAIYQQIASLLGFQQSAGCWQELALLATRLFA